MKPPSHVTCRSRSSSNKLQWDPRQHLSMIQGQRFILDIPVQNFFPSQILQIMQMVINSSRSYVVPVSSFEYTGNLQANASEFSDPSAACLDFVVHSAWPSTLTAAGAAASPWNVEARAFHMLGWICWCMLYIDLMLLPHVASSICKYLQIKHLYNVLATVPSEIAALTSWQSWRDSRYKMISRLLSYCKRVTL